MRNFGVPCCPLLGGIVPPFWGNGADIVSAVYADELKNFDMKQHRAKVNLSPCVFYSKSFEITSRKAGHDNSEFRI